MTDDIRRSNEGEEGKGARGGQRREEEGREGGERWRVKTGVRRGRKRTEVKVKQMRENERKGDEERRGERRRGGRSD
ncbi:Single-stranded DNA-binding protein [Dissostichus eleginoides]|uniref:Single-stranded DNA-binding protein n=1 Tax=Dissostichus eleginoides TaxID=100907 RepID=A0AAD9C7A3_DISEL|nr:Single-stranded DNA-binding protein [Dissostichus eleginoides]